MWAFADEWPLPEAWPILVGAQEQGGILHCTGGKSRNVQCEKYILTKVIQIGPFLLKHKNRATLHWWEERGEIFSKIQSFTNWSILVAAQNKTKQFRSAWPKETVFFITSLCHLKFRFMTLWVLWKWKRSRRRLIKEWRYDVFEYSFFMYYYHFNFIFNFDCFYSFRLFLTNFDG